MRATCAFRGSIEHARGAGTIPAVSALAYALPPSQMIRSVNASRDTLGRVHMKLIDIVHQVTALTGGAPYAVIGGLAQILWARKTHTDDLDVLLAAGDSRAGPRRGPGPASRGVDPAGSA